MEQKLIDANKLKIAINTMSSMDMTFRGVCDLIAHFPTVEPIRGEWIVKSQKTRILHSNEVFKCKKCGHERSRYVGEILKYCPNCGADMRGGKE